MTKYSLDLTNKHELRFLSDLIPDMRAKVPRIDVLLVGAMARDLLLFYAHGIKARRATEDIEIYASFMLRTRLRNYIDFRGYANSYPE